MLSLNKLEELNFWFATKCKAINYLSQKRCCKEMTYSLSLSLVNFIINKKFCHFTVWCENQHIRWIVSWENRNGIRIDQCYLQGIYIDYKEVRRSKFCNEFKIRLKQPPSYCSPSFIFQAVHSGKVIVSLFVTWDTSHWDKIPCNCFSPSLLFYVMSYHLLVSRF